MSAFNPTLSITNTIHFDPLSNASILSPQLERQEPTKLPHIGKVSVLSLMNKML